MMKLSIVFGLLFLMGCASEVHSSPEKEYLSSRRKPCSQEMPTNCNINDLEKKDRLEFYSSDKKIENIPFNNTEKELRPEESFDVQYVDDLPETID